MLKTYGPVIIKMKTKTLLRNIIMFFPAFLIIFFATNVSVVYAASGNIAPVASTKETVTIAIEGKVIVFPDAQPYVDENKRTMVPARFIGKALGGTWRPCGGISRT